MSILGKWEEPSRNTSEKRGPLIWDLSQTMSGCSNYATSPFSEKHAFLGQQINKSGVRERKKRNMMWEWERVANSLGIRRCFNVRRFDVIPRRVLLKWATSKTWRWSFTPISEAEFPGSDAGAEVLTQILGKLSFRDTTQKCHTKTPANLQHPQPAVWAQIGLEMHINIDSVQGTFCISVCWKDPLLKIFCSSKQSPTARVSFIRRLMESLRAFWM